MPKRTHAQVICRNQQDAMPQATPRSLHRCIHCSSHVKGSHMKKSVTTVHEGPSTGKNARPVSGETSVVTKPSERPMERPRLLAGICPKP